MKRKLEPELMLDQEQALAYARADFEEAHGRFVPLFQDAFGRPEVSGCVLDLGCGPADISMRFARAYPTCTVHGLDGSPAMLELGWEAVAVRGLQHRVTLIEGRLPMTRLPRDSYDVVIGNSLLHHLPEASVVWEFIARWAKPGALVFMMDLARPAGKTEARELVRRYADTEPPVLKMDFLHSLRAAYLPEEIEAGLRQLGWKDFAVEPVTDRHLIAYGFCP